MNYFYVYQNRTYHEERSGGFLWSPQYARGGQRNAGYEAMREVRPGDVIFHSYMGEIVAISKAQTACYSHLRPGRSFEVWDREGWKIDTRYFVLSRPLKTEPFIPELYRMQPPNGPFTSSYRGKQQYLCNVSPKMFAFLIEKIIELQPAAAERQVLRDFVGEMPPDPPPPGPVTPEPPKTVHELAEVVDGCMMDVFVLEQSKKSKFIINIAKYPNQKAIIGKKAGETFTLPNIPLTYRIEKIYQEK